MLWLKSLYNCPAGEFYYQQSGRTFGKSPLISTVASELTDFRRGNGLDRATYQEALEDIVRFTVTRLGPNSEWVMEVPDQPAGNLLPQPQSGCAGCGAVVT